MAPEKRPSVTSATDSPSPAPTTEAVTLSSSRIPVRPQAPRTGRRARRRRAHARSHRLGAGLLAVEHARGPGVRSALGAGELDEAAFGSKIAVECVQRPGRLNGCSSVRSTSPSGAAAPTVASSSVRPATVGAEPSTWPPRTSSRIGAAVPPARWKSAAMNGPAGAGSPAPAFVARRLRDLRAGAACRLACDREQVQDPVRRAAAPGDPGHRVQERAPVEEPPRPSPPARRAAPAPRPRRRLLLRVALVGGDQAVADRRDSRGGRAQPPSCWR